MFSGIVEALGKIVNIEKERENIHFSLSAPFVGELQIDQSISHNGVCLTVVEKEQNTYTVTAIQETLIKSSLGYLQVGAKVNLERSMLMNGRLDGHIVQGHVDQTAQCIAIEEADGSWYYTFRYEQQGDNITIEKGSITVDGVSLTVVNSQADRFSVAIIPYTYENTVFHTYKEGSVVNLEFDVIGKYVAKYLSLSRGT